MEEENKDEEEEEKKKLENRNLLLVIIISLILLTFVSIKRFEIFQNSLSEVKIPKFETEIKSQKLKPIFPSEENQKYKEFVSPDGKFKVKYLSGWLEMNSETFKPLTQGLVQNSEIRDLFLAQKIKLETGDLILFVIQELPVERDSTPKEVIEDINERAKEQNIEMKVEKTEIKNDNAYFEAEYKKQNINSTLFSREKFFLTDYKVYIISFINLSGSWSTFEREINEIFNSAQLTE